MNTTNITLYISAGNSVFEQFQRIHIFQLGTCYINHLQVFLLNTNLQKLDLKTY